MSEYVQKMFPAMGTVFEISAVGEKAAEAAETIKKRLLSMEASLSFFRPDSEVSSVSRAAGVCPVTVSEDTFRLFELGRETGQLTGGAFDVTAGPLAALWKSAIRCGVLPDRRELRRMCRLVDYRDIVTDREKNSVYLKKKEQAADFGGLAKGYAADTARDLLLSCGVRHALLNFGGTVTVLGEACAVGIRNPFDSTGEEIGTLTVQNESVVTSGTYEQSAEISDRRIHHIVDPRTGKCSASGVRSVTLVGRCAAVLDALATAAVVLGPKRMLPILNKQNIEAVFILDSGEIRATPGLGHRLRLNTECTITGAKERKTS